MRLINFIDQDQNLTNFINKSQQVKNSLITGANAGAFSLLIKKLVHQTSAPLLLIEENEHKAQDLFAQLTAIMADDCVQLFRWMRL